MSIKLTISLILDNVIVEEISINRIKIQLSPNFLNTSYDQSLEYEWNEVDFELALKISGPTGGSAILIINNETNQTMYIRRLDILKKEIAERKFTIKKSVFRKISNHLHPDNNIHLSGRKSYNSNEQQKGIIKTEENTNAEIDVFYATDRNKVKGDDNYGNKRDEIRYGTCRVNIPKQKKLGEISRPSWWKFEFRENRNKHIMITSLTEQDEADFFITLDKCSLDAETSAFVFIHGYNTSFNDAIYRTAQLCYDLGFKGLPITYSWPSADKALSYPYDEESVLYTNSSMVNFFKDLHRKTGLKKIHIIAHSMGNRVLTNAIINLHTEGFFAESGFDQVILAAPDLDAEVFLKELSSKIITSSKRITLYASSGDKALKFSRTIHSSMIRLGESGKLITVCEGLDTIDASKTDTSVLGHGYFSSTAPLINDIFQLLNFNTEPAKRNLLKYDEYWSFK